MDNVCRDESLLDTHDGSALIERAERILRACNYHVSELRTVGFCSSSRIFRVSLLHACAFFFFKNSTVSDEKMMICFVN